MTPKELNKFADEQLKIKEIKETITKALLAGVYIKPVSDCALLIYSDGYKALMATELPIDELTRITKIAIEQLKKENNYGI